MFCLSDIKECKEVFAFFKEISDIPHGSGHTDAIADYLVSFAQARGLSYYRDAANNVLIRKGASAGYENHPTVILQGHTDMVLAKEPSCTTAMEREGLELYLDGDYLRAKGTTLGADDGIAVAYALAILDADDLTHPPIEALFTSDEEIGLLGAAALDPSVLKGSMLINIDSDGEGCFTVGCAGGVRCDMQLPMQPQPLAAQGYRVTVSGLNGGHSGVEIHKGRANALRLLGACLSRIDGVRIAALSGGSADNAIAATAQAIVVSDASIMSTVDAFLAEARTQYADTDAALSITVEAADVREAYTADDSARMLCLLTDLPNGVIAMCEDPEGLVQTSLNCGVASLDADGFSLCVSVRSSLEDDKRALVNTLRALTEAQGGVFTTRGGYPAWEYRADSPLREVACRVHEEMYGKPATTMVIHAGLECGVFAGKIPSFDSISLGPDNYDLHTPEEHLSVSSAIRVYHFLTELLRHL